MRSKLPASVDAWGYSLKMLMGAVVASGAIITALYTHMQRNVLRDPTVAKVSTYTPSIVCFALRGSSRALRQTQVYEQCLGAHFGTERQLR